MNPGSGLRPQVRSAWSGSGVALHSPAAGSVCVTAATVSR